MALASISTEWSVPCPICFENPTDVSDWRVQYANVENHSWHQLACNGHGICWACLARHAKVQVLSEGKINIRCPGECCNYHLLKQDISTALYKAESPERSKILDTLASLKAQACQDRLKEMVFGTLADKSSKWLLQECQPCPLCFVLSRRETGCNHIICRCGADFCFKCGAPNFGYPNLGVPHEEAGCICPYLDDEGSSEHVTKVFFAAWLRTAHCSPCQWLPREDWPSTEPSHFVTSLGFWLWIAGADIAPPDNWHTRAGMPTNETLLPELRWVDTVDFSDSEDTFGFIDTFFYHPGLGEQDLAGHLKKEINSEASKRMLQRGAARRRLAGSLSEKKVAEADQKPSKATRHNCSKVSKRSHRTSGGRQEYLSEDP